MSESLLKCIPFLDVLRQTHEPKRRAKYLKLFKDCILKTIREICVNLLLGNIDLTLAEKNRLRRYKRALRLLAAPETKESDRKRIILDKSQANILAALLPPTLRRLKDVKRVSRSTP